MAGGSLTISSNLIAFPGGQETLNLTVSTSNAVVQQNSLTFASATFITTTGPIGATECIIVPPTGNASTLTLKGITGDTGVGISATQPTAIAMTPGAAGEAIGLTSGGAIVGVVTLLWF